MLKVRSGVIILIKKLNKKDINFIGCELEKIKDKEEFKEYFEFGNDIPNEAYLVNDTYYIDIFNYKGIKFFGIIKISEKKTSLKNAINLFYKKFEECGKCGYWFVETQKIIKFNNKLIKYMRNKGAIIKQDSINIDNKKINITLFLK